ncbi:dihydropteroate synthase [Brooklawnia sp.]|uniref:dihydropteroate synthase n=1 Tax=Brooklawnia sp. TaxID=2699740 RepID=UPI00311DB4D7
MTGRTLVMGVVNVTPDSFSDGGLWLNAEDAIMHGKELIAQGADLLDIGGESTRPGAVRPPADEELRRVLPVVRGLAGRVPISVDTMRAQTAACAVEAGAQIINDVSGGLADPQMLRVVSETGVDYVCQHWRGHGAVMNDLATYTDVVPEVVAELRARLRACADAGIDPAKVIVDPGLGFAKTADQDWALLAHLHAFTALGHRVLIGASRKRFLGHLLSGREPMGRDAATAAVSVICAQQGVWAVRTHEVRGQRDAIAVVERIHRS